MSVLATIDNIKIPAATEGVIRTAQLDDPISPADSVQLAVNMNFDRVGAIITRPGVTAYADALVDSIKNYGTLRNSVVPPGFENIYQLGSTTTIQDPDFFFPSAVKVSDTKVAVFWVSGNGHGFCRNLSIDIDTGSVTPIGTALEFFTGGTINEQIHAALSNSSIVIATFGISTNAGYACGFDVSGTDIVAGTPFNWRNGIHNTNIAPFDGANHCIGISSDFASGHIYGTIFEVNVSTLAVTCPGALLDLAVVSQHPAITRVSDGVHAVAFWGTNSDNQSQCFAVNGGWDVTAIGSPVTYGALQGFEPTTFRVSATRYLVIYRTFAAIAAQVVALNGATFAVTLVGTPLSAGGFTIAALSAASLGDNQHYAAIASATSGNGYAQIINVNNTTWDVTIIGSQLTGFDIGDTGSVIALPMESAKVMAIWSASPDAYGKTSMFITLGDVVNGRYLYAGSGTSVFNRTTGAWTSRRSGLAVVSKPRFSQYLNYIWMVNGNAQIGGDNVATSNGGAFGTDLVPGGFPPGDFIHAGFEGRVWVANKTLGIIYYTDIVQFTPPSTYALSYNPSVNFISSISPQTGQTFTALYRVPRALLVFTEDTITRIYGASSVDAYPAYNVGTYSQESIIETKTGIYFHHSSGFYQFDYGSQPVEISRRIIDFVKAIPRSYYENITGVYDGFDCVEWSIGPVTVEGVVFSNCVVRYTISTQVWTIYDYVANTITAMIFFDDGTSLVHLMGTSAGKTGSMDVGDTDFGVPFYWEFIDRWRAFTEMYYQIKSISGFNVYSENAAGANLLYQVQKSGPNAWAPLGTVTDKNNALLPNSSTEDFDVLRLRLAGTTSGPRVVVHGFEITQLTIKGQDEN